MTSLQLSQINVVTEGRHSLHQNSKSNAKMSVNSSSVFLKNFKENVEKEIHKKGLMTERKLKEKQTK